MKQGIALLGNNTPASLKEAVSHFDRAIDLRRRLPLDANPMFRHGLAAGWMNRGDALTRLGSPENLAEALRSYDAALETLSLLPLDVSPLFRRRLAIAWQNRGLTLLAQDANGWAEAEQSFTKAIAILHQGNAAMIEDRNYLLATVWMNKANALVRGQALDPARTAAKQALAVTIPAESSDLALAEAGLNARHILCQAIAGWLAGPGLSTAARDELIAEATDAVDDGMRLAQNWEQRGATQFRPLAQELFRFGARIYQMFQPHFLNEFLLETLDPAHSTAFAANTEMHAAALESLWRTFRELQRGGFAQLNTPQFDEFLERLRELRMLEDRLAELRRQYLRGEGQGEGGQ